MSSNKGLYGKYQKKYYENNKEYYKKKARDRKKKLRQWYHDFKSTLSCSCGENHPSCIVFHHKDGDKEMDISMAINYGWGIKRILSEIGKCVIMCSNCHRKLHYHKRQNGSVV